VVQPESQTGPIPNLDDLTSNVFDEPTPGNTSVQSGGQQKVRAADFLALLRRKLEPTDPAPEDEEPAASKPKRVRKNSTKSFANFLERHYDKEDDEDYHTIFNTSVNKYGREVASRQERPDLTELFRDESCAMDITKVTDTCNETRTDETLNLTAPMSIQGDSQTSDDTKRFTDCQMEMSHQVLQLNKRAAFSRMRLVPWTSHHLAIRVA
jgi:hypothetical protein